MYNIIIWGMGRTYNQYINMIKLQEILGKIRGGGITGKEPLYEYLDGYKYIPPDRLVSSDFDYVIVASDYFFEEIAIEAEHVCMCECRYPKRSEAFHPLELCYRREGRTGRDSKNGSHL